MQKHKSFYVLFIFIVAIAMTAGCAKQEVVKKDEGIAPTPVAGHVEPLKSGIMQPHESVAPVTTVVTPSTQQSQKTASMAQLQSALNKIYFDFDSSTLSESARNILTNNATPLTKEQTAKIRIEGNCDERGSAEYNLALGERRAKAAQQYLVTLGVKPDRISTISYGKEKPAVSGNNETAWAKDRRDEFVVITP